MSGFPTILSIAEMRALSLMWRGRGERIAFVPTMGALHEGHLDLVRRAKSNAQRVVVSIFVNPLQFGPNEDFARYPRTLQADVDKLSDVGVDVVFAPNAMEIYPAGFQTAVYNKEMSRGLCGAVRPGHFEGVLTVVLKLFQIVGPDQAFFGKKDYQQWRLIERMTKDLCLPLEIVGAETLREVDGLAMSSRNRYLSAPQREQATLLYRGMSAAATAWKNGERHRDVLLGLFAEKIRECPEMSIQYASLVRQTDLSEMPADITTDEDVVMIVAVLYGDVRLIDNLEFART